MNDLLDDSRIQAGHLEMRQDICDLPEIVRICRVGVESAPGSGSTFWFALPLSQ